MTHIKCKKCNGYGCNCYPINPSNKTMVVPRSGSSAFQAFLAYNPDYPYSEDYWVENYYKGESGESARIGENGNWWVGDVDTGVSASPSPQEWESTEW